MKKFCNKLAKQQWRVTVPNINTAIFKKSSSSESKEQPGGNPLMKSTSGCYDLEKAVEEFEKTRNVAKALTLESSSESDSDDYEDARETSEKLSSVDADTSIYADVDSSQKSETSKCYTDCNTNYEYDVPKISFRFLCDESLHEYQVVNIKKPNKNEQNCDDLENEEMENPQQKKEVHVSEVKITLETPTSENSKTSDPSKPSKSETDIPETINRTLVDLYLTKSFSDFSSYPRIMKSGSDPNISYSQTQLHEDDGLYKIPGAVRRYRISQSLENFNLEEVEVISSAHSSIEHISCSQVLVGQNCDSNGLDSTQNSVTMDYCKTRSKMPPKKRKITLLRKPKTAGWTNWTSKLNNVLAEQAAKQRVGAFMDKDGPKIAIEEVYKNSKNRCKKMLRNTGKIFRPKRDQESPNLSEKKLKKTPKKLKASDIEHAVCMQDEVCSVSLKSDKTDRSEKTDKSERTVMFGAKLFFGFARSLDEEKKDEKDFSTIKNAFRRSKSYSEPSQNGFEDLRRYVKQGGDFCKELASILQERSEAELQYAKSLSKLGGKLVRACREGIGGVNEAWRSVASELEARAEAHRTLGTALAEDAARPLRNLTENQHKTRKQIETTVDKAAKGLTDWRTAEAKTKKHSHACARDNEKLQDALLDIRLAKTTSLIQLAHMHSQKAPSEKENAKLEGKKRKAEDAVKKADIEYYTLCVRAERARLEWESAVLKGTNTFQTLEEERLNNLKSILTSYLHHNNELGPRLIEITQRLASPVAQAESGKDLLTFMSLRNSTQQISEQLLPDFYCEHITLAMNRERRKQALVKLLQLIRQDIERERKSKNGLENLSKAMKQTPNFGAEESQQNVSEKLYHMKSMLTYLEAARYKVQSALAELDSRPRAGHPLAPHITVTRDKSGLQQSILKVPQWLREEWVDQEKSPLSEKSIKSEPTSDTDMAETDWTDRGAADGNSNQPDSDFDEFSSQGSGGLCNTEESPVQPIAQCKALYAYTPNLPDELTLHPGDILSVYRKQEDGWWLGECNGSVGIFPATYVETL